MNAHWNIVFQHTRISSLLPFSVLLLLCLLMFEPSCDRNCKISYLWKKMNRFSMCFVIYNKMRKISHKKNCPTTKYLWMTKHKIMMRASSSSSAKWNVKWKFHSQRWWTLNNVNMGDIFNKSQMIFEWFFMRESLNGRIGAFWIYYLIKIKYGYIVIKEIKWIPIFFSYDFLLSSILSAIQYDIACGHTRKWNKSWNHKQLNWTRGGWK